MTLGRGGGGARLLRTLCSPLPLCRALCPPLSPPIHLDQRARLARRLEGAPAGRTGAGLPRGSAPAVLHLHAAATERRLFARSIQIMRAPPEPKPKRSNSCSSELASCSPLSTFVALGSPPANGA